MGIDCAGLGTATQRWHPVAAKLAGIEAASAPYTQSFSMGDAGQAHTSATVQDFSCKLGRIEDLITELDSLRLDCPALASVTAQGHVLVLVFLGLEAEIKFTVRLELGGQSSMPTCSHSLCCWQI